MAFPYDIAISFAGEDRPYASSLAQTLNKNHGLLVFYDEDEQAQLIGKNLFEYLVGIYKDKAAYCVILVSQSYREKRWTRHEWKAVQARAFEEPDRDYILPVRLDDSELPGLLPTLGFVDGRAIPPEHVATLIAEKVHDAAFRNDLLREAERLYVATQYERVLQVLSAPEVAQEIEALRIKANTFGKLGDYERAVACLHKVVGTYPKDFLAHFLLGIFYFRLGQFDESVRYYEIADSIAPGHPTVAIDMPFARKLSRWCRMPVIGPFIGRRVSKAYRDRFSRRE